MRTCPRPAAVMAIPALLALLTCSTTQLTAVWKDPAYPAGSFKKIAVIALFKKYPDRQTFETVITERLRKTGVGSVDGLSFMAPDQKYEYAALEKKLNAMQVDGILIVRVKAVDRRRIPVPDQTGRYPETHYDKYANYYYDTYRTSHDQGTVTTTDIFTIETSMYANSNDRLVWRAETRSYVPGDAINGTSQAVRMANELSELIVRNLKECGLL